jgi:cytochrome c oxidase subunit 2
MNIRVGLLALLLTACASPAVSETPRAVKPTLSAAEQGRILFRDKGCVTCHVNARVEGVSGVLYVEAPDLTAYTNDPGFLRRWLADPPAVRPGTEMPNLRLSAAEIESLIAFLNEESR